MNPSVMVPVGAFVMVLSTAALLFELLHPAEAPAESLEPVVRSEAPPARPVRWVSGLAAPADPYARDADRVRLLQAGFADPSVLVLYYLSRAVLTVALPTALVLALPRPLTSAQMVALLGAALCGYLLPLGLVVARRNARQTRLQFAVPNVLDMLVSCLEAGLGTDAALRYVAREVRVASADLANELDQANGEMSAGTPRHEALRKLDERTGIDELSALVGVLGQAERFGAGVAPSLRAHAQLARRQRALRAEQRAARASPMLTVVMILFILPSLFVVLLGPTIVQVVEHFLPTLSAGS